MKPVITDIAGVGPVAAEALTEHSITTLNQLASATVAQVAAVPGFSEARAAKVIAAAAEVLSTTAPSPTDEEAAPQKTTGEKTTGKGKNGKKDKKKGQGKGQGKGKGKGTGTGKGKGQGTGKGTGKNQNKKRK